MTESRHIGWLDKLLLAGLFLVIVALITFRDPQPMDTIRWAREQGSLILGGLLAVITGAVHGAGQAAYQIVRDRAGKADITPSGGTSKDPTEGAQ